jgi:hypothetical protein
MFMELWDQEFDPIIKTGEHSGQQSQEELDALWIEIQEHGYAKYNVDEKRWDLQLPETRNWGSK